MNIMFWLIFVFATGIKLLLINSYRSTDFEVHRNWMAITHSLPLSRWYFENTSEWTLDYPPFFAYFEWVLSHIAKLFDPQMLEIQNLNYDSRPTIIFQRLSVICTDVLFAVGVKKCMSSLKISCKLRNFAAGVILLCNVGLIFVDHIHFQYNGFLFGILLLSIGFLLSGSYLTSCILFASLLNLKHIFLYMAPAFGAFYLKFYCFDGKNPVWKIFSLLVTGLSCFVISYGPFYKHLPQVLSRLFPFKRGLTHAYWAPNFWALYNFADKAAEIVLKIPKKGDSNTSGLVQEYTHVFLPKVTPIVTFILTGMLMIPCVVKLLFFTDKSNKSRSFLQAVVLCACTSFMFGWHVHEKAILMVLIPMSLLGILYVEDARYTFLLSVVGYYSLFPLLYPMELTLVKYSLFLAYILSLYFVLKSIHRTLGFHWYEWLYLIGMVSLPMYEYVIGNVLRLNERFPFLPLLLTSLYCGVGVSYVYLKYYISYMFKSNTLVEKKKKKSK